jgi:hypothetical protein
VQFDRYGPADVLHVVDRPRPTVGEGQVLVRVAAASINPGEIAIRTGAVDSIFQPVPRAESAEAGVPGSAGCECPAAKEDRELVPLVGGHVSDRSGGIEASAKQVALVGAVLYPGQACCDACQPWDGSRHHGCHDPGRRRPRCGCAECG